MRPVVVVALALAVAGCGGTDDADLRVDRARIGATPIGADAALYFDVTAPDGDRLVAVDAEVATATSLHVTGSSDGTMIEVDGFDLPPGATVRLEPFGDHVMLEQVSQELEPGDRVDVTLRFADHEPVQIAADVSQLYDLAWEDS